MKINHPNSIPSLNGSVANKKAKATGADGAPDFASVLKQTSEKMHPTSMPVAATSQPVLPSMLGFGFETQFGSEKFASHLLDTLESYQRLLADPEANLRRVQPLVDQMKAQANEAQPLMAALPNGHVVKGVIEETLMHINKEIARFDRGEYVDE
jgi:hypothetical protein